LLSNQLIQILHSFSKKEMTRFNEFAYSPYFNKHLGIRTLVGYLSKIYPDFNDKNCNREVILKNVFPSKKNKQNELALIFTYTLRLMEKFLTQEQFKENDHFHKILLLRSLRNKKQFRFYEKINQKFDRELESSQYKDSEHFNIQFLKASESDSYYTERSKHEQDQSIQQKQNNLDNYYLALKLRDTCEMIFRTRIIRVDYSTRLMESLIEEIKQNAERYAKNPSIIVYFRIYQMIINGEHQYYYDALPVIQENSRFFSNPELHTIYNYLQNYCIEQINKGQGQFLQESFNLYKDQLEKELLTDGKGFLSQWHYKNIVTAGIRLKEMDWTYDFIEKYKARLNPKVVENAYTFNLASYFYSDRQLEKVLELLVRVEYTDIRYSLAAKSLLLRTYYDLEENEALISLTRSFSQYLSRNTLIPESRKKAMSNLVRFTNRAFQIKSNIEFVPKEKSLTELSKLKTEMDATNIIINKDWLDQKLKVIEELIVK
jgi:hypothetical protein